MKINDAVSLLRTILKEHNVTTAYPDAALWKIYSIALNKARKDKLNRYGYINPNYYHTFCIEMIQGLDHQCACIAEGCKALVSKFPLPTYLTTNTKATLVISTLGGKPITLVNDYSYVNSTKYDEAYRNTLVGFIENKLIVIPNQINPRVLKVSAIWEDLADWEDIQHCINTEESSCTTNDLDIGVDPSLEADILKEVYRILGLTLQLKEDNTSDNNSEIK